MNIPSIPVITLHFAVMALIPSVAMGLLINENQKDLQDNSPNIIIIMADDMGYGDLGCYGNVDIKTPMLDRMASEGIRFLDFHTNGAVCTPTRAALLTGNYQQRAGLEGVIYVRDRDYGISGENTTLAKVFQKNGFATGLAGKWHLGFIPESHPLEHGFDEFYGFLSGNVDYISHRDNLNLHDWWYNREPLYEDGYATDLITEFALKFIERNKETPFFLFISHPAPHFPFQGPDDSAERLPGKTFKAHGSRPDREQAYKEMIESLDLNIGRIFDYLDENELDDNTLVFFCSDNGAMIPPGSNGVLRGQKGGLFEGGHRVPAIVRFPGKVPAGLTSGELVLTMDLFPTLLSIARITERPITDGIDISGAIIHGKKIPYRNVYWRYLNQKMVRNGNWKYLQIDNEMFLFHLGRDVSEQKNLLKRRPRKAKVLRNDLNAWEEVMSKYSQKTSN
jgi:arylsulfatase A